MRIFIKPDSKEISHRIHIAQYVLVSVIACIFIIGLVERSLWLWGSLFGLPLSMLLNGLMMVTVIREPLSLEQKKSFKLVLGFFVISAIIFLFFVYLLSTYEINIM